MFNVTLFLILVLYILSLGIGFRISEKNKDKHNKKYHKFKNYLMFLTIIIFAVSLVLSYRLFLDVSFGVWVLGLNLFFIIYFLILFEFKTRCWMQHRMIFYNFFMLILIYIFSLLFLNKYILSLVLLVYLYCVVEFSFAKFKIGFEKIWD